MTRLPLFLLAAFAVGTNAQTAASGPSSTDRLAIGSPVYLPTAVDLSAAPLADAPEQPAADADASVEVVDTSGDGLIAVPVAAPAPVEDPVQFRAPRAPVRMELSQTRRRVVLLPGVAAREPVATHAATFEAPSHEPLAADAASHVVYSRAMVVVGEGGRREVRYVSPRGAALDLGADAGCGAGAVQIGLQLRGLRATALRRGMRGDAVRAMQSLLCAAGYEVDRDGVFDGALDGTVRQFQRDHNASGRGRPLSVDGAFGARTRQAVEAAIAAR